MPMVLNPRRVTKSKSLKKRKPLAERVNAIRKELVSFFGALLFIVGFISIFAIPVYVSTFFQPVGVELSVIIGTFILEAIVGIIILGLFC